MVLQFCLTTTVRSEKPEVIVSYIAKFRNDRLLSTMRIYGLDNLIYHCVIREPNKIKIYESPMDLIDISNIGQISTKSNGNIIYFNDGKNEYSFNLNKNTLFKRFDTKITLISIDIKILKDPYSLLYSLLADEEKLKFIDRIERYESIILPLFSDRGGRNVPDKSGLNQWNANGRNRNLNEVYIPIPSWIHKKFPEFFPLKDEVFSLKLPNGSELKAKLCQAGKKALMSNPNSDLGKWLLREVMNLKDGELLTYEMLRNIGIDSAEVYKVNEREYKIDFRPMGTYDEFFELNKK